MLKHTIEELGEFADTHGEGRFHIFQSSADDPCRAGTDEQRWGCQIGGQQAQYAATPKECVQKVLDAHDAATNPDHF